MMNPRAREGRAAPSRMIQAQRLSVVSDVRPSVYELLKHPPAMFLQHTSTFQLVVQYIQAGTLMN